MNNAGGSAIGTPSDAIGTMVYIRRGIATAIIFFYGVCIILFYGARIILFYGARIILLYGSWLIASVARLCRFLPCLGFPRQYPLGYSQCYVPQLFTPVWRVNQSINQSIIPFAD